MPEKVVLIKFTDSKEKDSTREFYSRFSDAIRMFEVYLEKGTDDAEAAEIREHIELLRTKMLE